ncbi:MAG: Mycoredoxin, partial [uncultured Nocardioidaceae bacterium]
GADHLQHAVVRLLPPADEAARPGGRGVRRGRHRGRPEGRRLRHERQRRQPDGAHGRVRRRLGDDEPEPRAGQGAARRL